MSDDLKINLPTNLSVPMLAEPKIKKTKMLPEMAAFISDEARESIESLESLTGDSRGAQNISSRSVSIAGQDSRDTTLEEVRKPSMRDSASSTVRSTGIAACPQSETSPTLTTQEQKQPSMRPSPISGVTPPVHTRWKKGESGNPGGRPKHVSRAYIKHLETVVDEATGETNADKIAQAQIKKATLVFDPGSTAAAREIRQATETDDEANKGGGFNIGSLNVAILNQIQRAATGKELE